MFFRQGWGRRLNRRNCVGGIMEVREANKNLIDYTMITDMAKQHPTPEYDCSFKEWKDAFVNIFQSPKTKAWIAFDGDKPIGYVIGIRDNYLRNQIIVFDIYLKEDFRGKNLLINLIEKLTEWARKDKALRIQWTSKYSSEKWERILSKLNLKVDEYKTFTWEVC